MYFKISFCLLALIVSNLASPSEYSGLLSRLYKKASSENRPLIVVLDNSVKGLEETRAAKPREVNVEIDRNVPLNLLELLHSKHHYLKHETKKLSFDLPLTEQREDESSFKHNDLERLKNRLERERQKRERQRRERKERRERREKHNRAQDYEGQNVNTLKDNERNQENRDRKRERLQNKNQDKYHVVSQDKGEEISRGNNGKRALRTSVIKNLLRTFNDLNCDAKEECQDECDDNYKGKNQDNCEDKCEAKYDCEETEKEDDPCASNEDCDESEESTAGSTKGERLVTVTEKCLRC